jgi:hypothetical protein
LEDLLSSNPSHMHSFLADLLSNYLLPAAQSLGCHAFSAPQYAEHVSRILGLAVLAATRDGTAQQTDNKNMSDPSHSAYGVSAMSLQAAGMRAGYGSFAGDSLGFGGRVNTAGSTSRGIDAASMLGFLDVIMALPTKGAAG